MPGKHDAELYRLKAELCKTFSDPKRLMLINELRGGEKAVGALVEALKIPQAVVSRNLAILRNHGIVGTRREGVNIYYSLSNPKIIEACDMVHQILLEQMEKNREMADKIAGSKTN
jgi:ArsR family transcriptional regulator, virulence genes transcriptional regulator